MEMYRATATLIGVSPISFSKYISTPRNKGESYEAYEERTWKERAHVRKDGMLIHPAMALKNCLSDIAKFLSETVPGKGKATYTKHFEAGIMVTDDLCFGVGFDLVVRETLYVPSDGVRGGGKRVIKYFPTLMEWQTPVTIFVLDPQLFPSEKRNVVEEYLEYAGKFIGIGRWRARNNGLYGRWSVKDFKIVKVDDFTGEKD